MTERRGWSGVGYEFSVDDQFVGVDLDGCRNPDTGEIAEWARRIIDKLDSYSEVSPSGSGVKIFVSGRLPIESTGRQNESLSYEPVTDAKAPGIELYHHGRYFVVTGEHVESTPATIEYRQADLDDLWREYFGDDRPQGRNVDVAESTTSTTQTPESNNILAAIACLQSLGAEFYDNYARWLHVGMVLHSVNNGPEMFAVWDGWSRKSAKYDADECTKKWHTFKAGENGERLTIASLIAWARENSADEWDDPASLDAVEVSPWPAEGVFSESLHEYVAAVAESLQVPQDSVAMSMLGKFAVAFAKKIEVHVRGDHREPVNLFVVNAAPSGERKSVVCRELIAPLHKYEREVNDALGDEAALYESRKRTLAKKLAAAETAAASPKDGLDQQSAEPERDALARIFHT